MNKYIPYFMNYVASILCTCLRTINFYFVFAKKNRIKPTQCVHIWNEGETPLNPHLKGKLYE